MNIKLKINNSDYEWETTAGETLLSLLRRNGLFSVKSGGCQRGECGACTILLDGKPVNSCMILAAQADGHRLQTVEALGEHPESGWKASIGLHPIQQALVDSGAIQCGYCTPAMVLAAKALLDKNPHPTEGDVREALAPILCRCTGYIKPVLAILQAAEILRGETPIVFNELNGLLPQDLGMHPHEPGSYSHEQNDLQMQTRVMPKISLIPQANKWHQVGKPEKKVD